MKIRTKLLIILLILAITPLLIVTAIEQSALRLLGNEFAKSSGERLQERSEDHLFTITKAGADAFQRGGRSLQTAVETQALAAQHRLFDQSTPQPPRPPRLASSLDTGVDLPDDYAPSPFHSGESPDGEPVQLSVSFREATFVLAPNADPEHTADQMLRLAGLEDFFSTLTAHQSTFTLWQNISLESGLHLSYPGHTGYPDGYDPRLRRWYTDTVETGRTIFTMPLVDASLGRPILTGSTPIRDPDGNIIGVASGDVRLDALAASIFLPQQWQDDARAYLVRDATEDPQTPTLEILIGRSYDDQQLRWDIPIRTNFLTADSRETRETFRRIAEGKSGVVSLTIADAPAVFAYAPLNIDFRGRQVALVVAVPRAEVVAEATAARRFILERTNQQLAANITTIFIVAGIVAIVAFIGSRRFTQPILELSNAAKLVSEGNLDVHLKAADRHTSDELTEMARAFDAMIPKLRDQLRLRSSLDLAMEVQQALLPAKPPEFPGLDIHGLSAYCDETGGDYFDFLTIEPIGPERLGIVVGDVTGHGIAAALLMTTARALLRTHASLPGSLAETISAINRALAEDSLEGRFMTLGFYIYDNPAETIRWVNAGHDPAILYDPASDSFEDICDAASGTSGGGIPLGIEASWKYEEAVRPKLTKGQILVIGTDGIWEQSNKHNQMFGKDRLREVVRSNADRSSREIAVAIVEAVHAHRDTIPQSDDITLVVIRAV
ncbi:MAG: HAMP domain-containing protein [Phycisphaeraceae bacterium]|nr:MAG: HAMP domain-containing protein [Phycisphaeraceae bacterium]